MRRRGIVSDDIIHSIDISNTLHGGISESKLTLSQHSDYRKVELTVPGISEENVHVKINNNQLLIYYERKIMSRGMDTLIPYIVYNKQIPYFIDVEKIHAQYAEGLLTVQLPFNELANGYHRDIPIDK